MQKCRPSEKYNDAYVLSTWFGPLLHELLTASMRRGMDAISLLLMEDQDSLAAFSSLALFGLMFLILLNAP